MQGNKKSVAANAGTVDSNKSTKTDVILTSEKKIVKRDVELGNKIDFLTCDLENVVDLLDSFISLYDLEGSKCDKDIDYDQARTNALIYVENLKTYFSILYTVHNILKENISKMNKIVDCLVGGDQ